MAKSNASSGGIGFFGLLTIVLITLKLCGVIDWSWIAVLSPLWLPVVGLIVICLIVFVGSLVFDPLGRRIR